ncbi:hypothetical protein BZG36_04570 [Bifiguratus adelaidae]|uniref:Rhodanese domain-containing protein n=1 Tax=Bifiguratus adelaidae TaxID=1938954 RepID=A0A261XUR3_9FUNG|nr:hypothetical protein BZG36_04570 [Bifiguratus adelaidae]
MHRLATTLPRAAHASTATVFSRFTDLVNASRAQYGLKDMTTKELFAKFKSRGTGRPSVIIVDVRERSEMEKEGVIPGAILLPRGILERDITKFVDVNVDEAEAPQDQRPAEVPTSTASTSSSTSSMPIVLYCAGGLRSILAAEGLVRLGYSANRVWNLQGGFDQWKEEGYDVTKVD